MDIEAGTSWHMPFIGRCIPIKKRIMVAFELLPLSTTGGVVKVRRGYLIKVHRNSTVSEVSLFGTCYADWFWDRHKPLSASVGEWLTAATGSIGFRMIL